MNGQNRIRVLWHINLQRLFNANYIYIYIYTFSQRFLNEYFVDNVLDKQDRKCLHRIKWFQFIIFLVQSCLSQDWHNVSILTFPKRSLHLEKLLSNKSESFTLYSNVFNDARCSTGQTLWLLSLYQHGRVSKSCMTNAQSGYYDILSSWFSESWSSFSQSGLDLKVFIVDVIIPALLPFCLKEFIDFAFQVSVWNPEFVRGQI